MNPEHETPHVAHSTGRRWLDLTLANSWPLLMYSTDNMDPQGNRRISLKIENDGIGPARVQTFEVWWQGQPVSTGPELLGRCCMTDATTPLDSATARSLNLVIGQVASRVIRAGEAETFLSLELKDANADVVATRQRM